MIVTVATAADRIRLTAIETMKGAFGNEGALPLFAPTSTLPSNKSAGNACSSLPKETQKTRHFPQIPESAARVH